MSSDSTCGPEPGAAPRGTERVCAFAACSVAVRGCLKRLAKRSEEFQQVTVDDLRLLLVHEVTGVRDGHRLQPLWEELLYAVEQLGADAAVTRAVEIQRAHRDRVEADASLNVRQRGILVERIQRRAVVAERGSGHARLPEGVLQGRHLLRRVGP